MKNIKAASLVTAQASMLNVLLLIDIVDVLPLVQYNIEVCTNVYAKV